MRLVAGTMAALFLMGGCATTSKDNTIPKEGPTMEDVYRGHMGNPGRDKGSRFDADIPRRSAGEVSPTAYTRTSANEIDNQFARLPNPDLVMYVFPHLTGAGKYPVPGYSTVFPMYETVEYAMPGEIAPREGFYREPVHRPASSGQVERRTATVPGSMPTSYSTAQRGAQ